MFKLSKNFIFLLATSITIVQNTGAINYYITVLFSKKFTNEEVKTKAKTILQQLQKDSLTPEEENFINNAVNPNRLKNAFNYNLVSSHWAEDISEAFDRDGLTAFVKLAD